MSKKICLVIGCSGQDGALLCLSLLKQGHEVIGTSRNIEDRKLPTRANHSILGIENDIRIENCDLKNFKEVDKLIEKYKPVEIYNLAAQSSVGKSYTHPQETLGSIINITLNILELARQIKYEGNIFFAGSSEIFGNTNTPATLEHKQKPSSPYAIAKQTSFNLVKMYRELHKLKCVTGILFNHESPLRSENFVTQKIITQALLCSKNKSHKLRLGNINVERDWGWAEEYVEGIQLINRSLHLKDQIVCTGKLTKLEEFIQIVFETLNLNWENHVTSDKKLFRKNEIVKSYGDPRQMKNDLNWEAKVDLITIIQKLIHFKLNS